MDWSAVAIVAATVMGPILAIQAQKYLERHRDQKRVKDNLFRVLMATRASRLSADHVQALNGIELAYYGGGKKEKKVLEAWKAYHDHLSDKSYTPDRTDEWLTRQTDLLIELLHEMAVSLGYDFDKTHIKNSWYSPQAHGLIEEEAQTIRRGFAGIFSGKASFPVTSIAATDEEAKEWAEVRKLLIEVLRANRPISGITTPAVVNRVREISPTISEG